MLAARVQKLKLKLLQSTQNTFWVTFTGNVLRQRTTPIACTQNFEATTTQGCGAGTSKSASRSRHFRLAGGTERGLGA